MSSAEDSGPQPTAHEVVPGCSLDRRTFIKGTAATAAIGAGIGASSGSAAATTSGTLVYPPSAPTLTPYLFAKAVGDRETNSDPNPDEIALHSQVRGAQEWWEEVFGTMLDNRLTDARMAAHVDSRAAIADAWEDGANSSEAHNYVYDAIEEFYSTPYQNTIETAATALAEVAYASRVARESSDVDDNFINSTILNDDYTGTGAIDEADSYIDDNLVTATFQLPDGTTFESDVPPFQHAWDDGDMLVYQFSDDLLAQYDSSSEMFTGLQTDNGNTADSRGIVGVMSHAEADLESFSFKILAEAAEQLEEIETQVSEVKANYDLDLVDSLYAAMDDGTIDPVDIRGIEGLSEHLSGTTDATSSGYQMALLMSLGLERSDLGDVSSMTLSYDGFTSREMIRDSNGALEDSSLRDYVTDLSIEGQLFTELGQDTTLSPNEKYVVNPLMAIPNQSEGSTVSAYTETFDHVETFSIPEEYRDSAFDPENGRMFVSHYTYNTSGTSAVRVYDTETWEEISVLDVGSQPYTVEVLPGSEDQLVVGVSDGIKIVDYSGTEIDSWSGADSAVMDIALDDDGNYFVGLVNGDAYLINSEMGQEWSYLVDTSGRTPVDYWNGYYALTSNGGETAVLDQSGAVLWDSLPTSNDPEMTIVPEENAIVDVQGSTTYSLSLDDGTENWSLSQSITGPYPKHDREAVVALSGSGLIEIDAGTGDMLREFSVGESTGGSIARTNSKALGSDYGGFMYRATAFDAPSGDHHNFYHGIISVDTLTDSDGNELSDDYEGDWDRPEHDEVDTEEYRTYIERVTKEHAEAIAADEEADGDDGGSLFGGLFDGSGGGELVGLGIIAVVVLAVIGIVTDLIPGLD